MLSCFHANTTTHIDKAYTVHSRLKQCGGNYNSHDWAVKQKFQEVYGLETKWMCLCLYVMLSAVQVDGYVVQLQY